MTISPEKQSFTTQVQIRHSVYVFFALIKILTGLKTMEEGNPVHS